VIAGLDPSLTHFGWLILDEKAPCPREGPGAILKYGVFKTDTKDGLLVQRLIMQRSRLDKFLKETDINFVAMEAPFFAGPSTELLYALNQYMHEIFLNHGTYILYLPPQRLKKYACPNINVNDITKHHINHQAKSELAMHGKRFSEHISDAYFAGKLGIRYHKWLFQKTLPDADLAEDEKEIFCGKHTFTRGPKKGITEYNGIIYRENDQFFDYSKYSKKTEHIIKEISNEQ
jgi:Holliday junction resolvasome RuvABC endonuclease subunit